MSTLEIADEGTADLAPDELSGPSTSDESVRHITLWAAAVIFDLIA